MLYSYRGSGSLDSSFNSPRVLFPFPVPPLVCQTLVKCCEALLLCLSYSLLTLSQPDDD